MQPEERLYHAHPEMFRSAPGAYIACCLLIAALGLGLLILLFWWLESQGTTLTVTPRRTILRKGILSKHTNEVLHAHVRNVTVHQSFFQRIFNVGSIGISSSGQGDVEIEAKGFKDPQHVRDLVAHHQDVVSA